jgi:hypothetical protein
MKRIFLLPVLALTFGSQALAAPVTARTVAPRHAYVSADSAPIEEFAFQIQNFKMNHQAEIHNLNIKIRYIYESGIAKSDYPDFLVIAKDIEGFLKSYPNKVDYWEIVNKNLTLKVLKKHPMLLRITSEIQVSPSKSVPYLRASIVTRSNPRRVGTK